MRLAEPCGRRPAAGGRAARRSAAPGRALHQGMAVASRPAGAAARLAPPSTLVRHFLPGLGKILQNSSGETSLRRTQTWQRVVPHRTATIFSAVADVEKYASFLPWCLSSRVLERTQSEDSDETVLLTDITVGYQTLKSTLNSRVEIKPMTRVHSTSEANEYLEHLSFTWDFRPIGEQTCRLDMTLGACTRTPHVHKT